MSKKRKKREYEDVVDLSGYPPWLKIFIVLIIVFVFVTAFVPGWILYTVIAIVVVSFVGISYWFYTKKGINVPKESAKTIYEGYKKLDEDWKKQQEKLDRQFSEKIRKVVPPGLRTRLVARARGRCENCGRDLYGNERIEIHHKNGNPADNRESNLLVVCGGCHQRLTGPPSMK